MAIESIVVVRFDEHGEISYHVSGDESLRLFIVDERCPNDRVFEYLSRCYREEIRRLIPEGSEIGSSQDERHKAIENVILAHQEQRPHLRVVEDDE